MENPENPLCDEPSISDTGLRETERSDSGNDTPTDDHNIDDVDNDADDNDSTTHNDNRSAHDYYNVPGIYVSGCIPGDRE